MNIKLDDVKITWTAPMTTTTTGTGDIPWIGRNIYDPWYPRYDRWPTSNTDDVSDILKRLRLQQATWLKEDETLVFELPGVDKNSIELEVINGNLILKYKNRKGVDIIVPDFKLDDSIDIDTLDVTFKDGLLLVKYQQKKTKKIKINY